MEAGTMENSFGYTCVLFSVGKVDSSVGQTDVLLYSWEVGDNQRDGSEARAAGADGRRRASCLLTCAFEAIWITSAWSVRSQWCSPGRRPTPRHARFQNETISWTSERHIHIAVWFHVRLVPSTTLSLLSKTCILQK